MSREKLLPPCYGEKYVFDPDFTGPVAERTCTDVNWLLSFAVYLALWIGLGSLVISNGHLIPHNALNDSLGLKCGVNASVRDKPYLLFLDFSQCLPEVRGQNNSYCSSTSICVGRCPEKAFVYNRSRPVRETINDLYCQYSVQPKLKTADDVEIAVTSGMCSSWYLPSEDVDGLCLPNAKVDYGPLQHLGVTKRDVMVAAKAMKKTVDIAVEWDRIVKSFRDNLPQVIICLIVAEAVGILFLTMLRYSENILMLSVIKLIGLVLICLYMSIRTTGSSNDEFGVPTSASWRVYALLLSGLMIPITIFTLFFRNKLTIALSLIREASQAIIDVPTTLLYPFLAGALHTAAIIWTVITLAYSMTWGGPQHRIGHVNDNASCSMYKVGMECDPQTFRKECGECYPFPNLAARFYSVFDLLGLIWSWFFVSGFSYLTLGGTFATWYWTPIKAYMPRCALCHSMWIAVRYHLGTAAYGSVVLVLCIILGSLLRVVRIVIPENVCFFCLEACCTCTHGAIDYMSMNAYIICAVHGKDFCQSAKDAFNLVTRNIVSVVVTTWTYKLILLFFTVTVAAIPTVLSFFILDEHAVGPFYFIAISSLFVVYQCFSVYEAGIDTLILCFVEDIERNDGSVSRPYFMSQELQELLLRRKPLKVDELDKLQGSDSSLR